MKNIGSCTGALLFVLVFAGLSAHAQSNESNKKRALKITGKVAEYTMKTTAKVAVETGKFVGKNVIVPFAKNIAWPAAKAAPPLAAKGVKIVAKGVTKGVKAVTNNRDNDSENSKMTAAH